MTPMGRPASPNHLGKHIPERRVGRAGTRCRAPAGAFWGQFGSSATLPKDGTVIGLGAPGNPLGARRRGWLAGRPLSKTPISNWARGSVDSLSNIVDDWGKRHSRWRPWGGTKAEDRDRTLVRHRAGSDRLDLFPTVLKTKWSGKTRFSSVEWGYRGGSKRSQCSHGARRGRKAIPPGLVGREKWPAGLGGCADQHRSPFIRWQFALEAAPGERRPDPVPTAVSLARNGR